MIGSVCRHGNSYCKDCDDEKFNAQQLHDFRCAALTGLCSIYKLYETGDKSAEFCMPTFEAQASCAEGIAQAMLKIARGES